MKEVIRALRPVKNRIRRNRFISGAAAGLAAGLGAGALLQAAAFLIPVPDRGLRAAAAAAGICLLTAAVSALRKVSNRTAAEAADACGLEERAVTALEEGEEEIRRLQREDARAALERLDVRQIRPKSVKKSLLAALGCGALLAVLLIVPGSRDREAAERKVFRQTLEQGERQIARAAEEDEAGLPEEKRNELRKITGDLKRDLQESRDPADALVALDRAEKRLEQLRRQTAGGAESAGKEAGEKNAAEGNGQAGKHEGNGSQAAGAGHTTARGDGGKGTEADQTGAANGQMKTLNAVSALKSAVNPSAGQNRNGQSGDAAQGGQNSQAGSSLPGAGNGGQGQQTGGGAGTGSTNLEQKTGGNAEGHAAGDRDPEYRERKYETIYDPERAEAVFRDETTHQNRLGDDGSIQLEAGPGRGETDGNVPWGEALREYADTESRAADRENLTVRERQWVTDYYTILAEQQN